MCPKNEEPEAACPVCGKLVSISVSSCPHCGAEFEEDEGAVLPDFPEDEGAACPVCAKVVSIEVSCCPHCGAEFEEETEGDFVGTSEAEDEGAACPVCGKVVGLELTACPNCGAEFDEEVVEEVIEVEEERVPTKAKARAKAKADAPEGAGFSDFFAPTSIIDLRVIGVALMLLGIVGSQIALMIDWYWTWVPAIEDNIALFVLLPVVVLIVGLLVFTLVKKAMSSGKEIPNGLPRISLSLFLFGIFALVVMLLWNSINSALQSSQMGVAGGFFVVVIIGIVVLFMGSKTAAETGSAA